MSSVNEKKIEVEILHLIEDIKKMSFENKKMHSETRKINRETIFYPFVAGAGVLGVAIALVKLFFDSVS